MYNFSIKLAVFHSWQPCMLTPMIKRFVCIIPLVSNKIQYLFSLLLGVLLVYLIIEARSF